MKNNCPVIVGVADVLDRTQNLEEAKETLSLIKEALEKAAFDATCKNLLQQIEHIEIVSVASWPYDNIAKYLGEVLPVCEKRTIKEGKLGGETPIRFINEMAQAIAKGEYQIGAICGGEAQKSAMKAIKKGVVPKHWTKPKASVFGKDWFDFVNPYATKYGLHVPTDVYPLYENNMYKYYGQNFEESQKESALLWHNMSKVSTENPYAWLGEEMSEKRLLKVDDDNRMIAFPYSKFMVANNSVNSSAALIMMSVEKAKALNIPEEKWIYVAAGAAANEPEDFLKRDNYHYSSSMAVVLNKTLSFNQLTTSDVDYFELYSCFPCVPKMARRILKLSRNAQLTVTGGLTFAGAALNNYMTASATQMVRKLRVKGDKGLIYGNGEFVTHHHAIILSRTPVDKEVVLKNYDVQKEADRQRGEIPKLIKTYEGKALLETYSVVYNRKGPKTAVIIAKTLDDERFLAKVNLEDKGALNSLVNPKRSLVGSLGNVKVEKGFNVWKFEEIESKHQSLTRQFVSKADELVTYEKYGKHIGIISLNRPEKRNAINQEMSQLLFDYVKKTEEDPEIRVVVLTSCSDQFFCAGADLAEFAKGNEMELVHRQGGFAGYVANKRDKIWIAAVNGYALGGGLEMLLASDMIICGKNAYFGLPEVKRGIFPAAGGVFRLPLVIPNKIALEMIATGDFINAQKAKELFLVNHVVQPAQVMEKALSLAEKISNNAPMAVISAMKIAREAMELPEKELWKLNKEADLKIVNSEDALEGSRAFIEKRKPHWKNR